MQKLKTYINPVDVHGTLWPMIIINQIIGTIPFKWTSKTRQYQLTLYGMIMFVLTTAVCTVCLVFSVLTPENYITIFLDSKLAHYASLVLLAFYFIGLLITYTYSFFQRHKLIKVIYMIDWIDKKLQTISVKINYRRCVNVLIRNTLFHLTCFVIYLGFNYMLQWVSMDNQHISVWISYFLPHLVMSSVVFMFLCILSHISYRIKLLNQVCESINLSVN